MVLNQAKVEVAPSEDVFALVYVVASSEAVGASSEVPVELIE